jgi:hypothetical protein
MPHARVETYPYVPFFANPQDQQYLKTPSSLQVELTNL